MITAKKILKGLATLTGIGDTIIPRYHSGEGFVPRFRHPSFRLELTDICMNCDHCYAANSSGSVATEAQIKAMVDTIEDFVENSYINHPSTDLKDAIDIHVGRTDVMFPRVIHKLTPRIEFLVHLLDEKGLNNLKVQLYTSGLLYQSDPEKFKAVARNYAKLFATLVPEKDITNRFDFFITTGDEFHAARLTKQTGLLAAAELFKIVREESRGIDRQRTPQIGDDSRFKSETAYDQYRDYGILVATDKARRFVEANGYPVDHSCPGLAIDYAPLVNKRHKLSIPKGRNVDCDRLTLTKDGYIHLCYCGISPIATQGRGSYKRAVHNVTQDPIVRTFVERGPLGIIELRSTVENPLVEKAIQTYAQFGACYLCREINEFMRKHITAIDTRQ